MLTNHKLSADSGRFGASKTESEGHQDLMKLLSSLLGFKKHDNEQRGLHSHRVHTFRLKSAKLINAGRQLPFKPTEEEVQRFCACAHVPPHTSGFTADIQQQDGRRTILSGGLTRTAPPWTLLINSAVH